MGDVSGTHTAGDTLISGTPQGLSDFIAAGTIVAMEGVPFTDEEVKNTCMCLSVVSTEIAWTAAHGNPATPNDKHQLKQQEVVINQIPQDIDTCVRRTPDADVSAIGVPDTVDIELIALSLQSVNPITVTFGALPSSDFDVVSAESRGVQTPGTMTFTPTAVAPNGTVSGTVSNDSLPVEFDLTFVDTASQLASVEQSALTLDYVNTPGTFNQVLPVPALSPWGMVLFAGILMATVPIIGVSTRRRQRKVS